VIPDGWIPHRRAEDDELLGFLRPVDDSPGRFVPVTVFGYPLAAASDEDDAQAVLESFGLSYLADTWLLDVAGHPDPISVQIVEASPERVRVKNVDFSYQADYGKEFTLTAPVDPTLRRR
jgi:hypothetical protein